MANLWKHRHVTAQQVRDYLRRLGVEVAVDLAQERLYVTAVTEPLEVVLPKREGEMYFHLGDRLEL